MASDIPRVARPTARDVHVWRIELLVDADRHVASLSPGEHTRLERLRGERRERFVISHGAMRQVLGAYLGCAPADVPLESPDGQPPTTAGLELSLTHCGQLALLAVAITPVGVDVEATSNVEADALAELAKATLTPAEMRQFRVTPPKDQARAWLRSWVRKEAVLKARGQGPGNGPLGGRDVWVARVDGLTLVALALGSTHPAAAAITPPAVRVTLKDWLDKSR